jgi:hypothetical protein
MLKTCDYCHRPYEKSEWTRTHVKHVEQRFCSPQCKALWHYYDKKKRAAAKPTLAFSRDQQPELKRYARR